MKKLDQKKVQVVYLIPLVVLLLGPVYFLFNINLAEAQSQSECRSNLTIAWKSPDGKTLANGSIVRSAGTYTVIGTAYHCLADQVSGQSNKVYLLICADKNGPPSLQSCPVKDQATIYQSELKSTLNAQVDIFDSFIGAKYTAEIKVNDSTEQVIWAQRKSSITFSTAVTPPAPSGNLGGSGGPTGGAGGTNSPPPSTNNAPANIPNYDTVVGNFDNPIKAGSVIELLFSLMNAFLLTIAVLAVAVIIYGGFQMIISAGNEKLLTSGKRAVTWAILGLIVALLSYSIVSIVENFIGVKPPG